MFRVALLGSQKTKDAAFARIFFYYKAIGRADGNREKSQQKQISHDTNEMSREM